MTPSTTGNGNSDNHHNHHNHRNLVAFRLDRQTYALPIEPIVKIVEMVTVTPIPQVNHSVDGVINFHGAAVPVVNLRRHLGLPEIAVQLHTPIVLVQTGEQTVGLIVDEVINVLSLPAGQITRPAEILPEGLGGPPLLQGLAHTQDGMVLLLDLDYLFLPTRAPLLGGITEETEPSPSAQTEEAVVDGPLASTASEQETET